MAIELGDFPRRTLLLGAGFSRNWGGLLAEEVWQEVFGHPAVRERPSVVGELRKHPSFEIALENVRASGKQEDMAAIEAAVIDSFNRMDRHYRATLSQPSVATSTVNDFISRFCPGGVGVGTGYAFSLNQDLLLERVYGTIPDRQGLAIPGIRWLGPVPRFPAHDADISEASPTNPAESNPQLRRHFNLIKLHGSMNWRGDDGAHSVVLGGGKEQSITRTPLLIWYHDIFEAVLCAGHTKLFVIGYGWQDKHINSVIATAVEKCGLEIYIWDTRDPRQVLPTSAHGKKILPGMVGKASRHISEVMPARMNAQTAEYERIVAEFF